MSTFAHATIFLGFRTEDEALIELIEEMFAGETGYYDDSRDIEIRVLRNISRDIIGCGIELAEVSYKSEWPEIICLETMAAEVAKKQPILEEILAKHDIKEKLHVLLQAKYT